MYDLWKDLKKKTDTQSKAQLEKIEVELAEKYFQNLKKASQGISCAEGGNIKNEMWKLKKHMRPRSRDPPNAMVNDQGNLVTDQDAIKEMAKEAYSERLRNRPIRQGLENIKDAKEMLAEKVMKVAKYNKTDPWSMDDLDAVLKSLKMQKSRDPNDLANEIFKPDVVGDDLKQAILKLR